MDKMGAKVSLDLALVKNKKDSIGSSWTEHDKLKITEEHLVTCHESIDQSYSVKANRTVLRMIHNAIFPNGRVNTRANQRLQHIVDTAEIRKIVTGENTGVKGSGKLICGEHLWSKCGLNFCSSLKTVRIWSMAHSSKTCPTYCRKLRRSANPKPSMMWTLNSLHWLWISFRISRMCQCSWISSRQVTDNLWSNVLRPTV